LQFLGQRRDGIVGQERLQSVLRGSAIGRRVRQGRLDIHCRRLGIRLIDLHDPLLGPAIGQPGRHVRLPVDRPDIDNISQPPHGNSGPQVIGGHGGQGLPGRIGGGARALLDLGGDGGGGQ